MKLYYDKRLSDPTYYAQQGIRNGKKTTTRNVRNFGKHSELLKITDDPLAYVKGEIEKMNEEYRAGRYKVEITCDFNERVKKTERESSQSTAVNVGYFFLQYIMGQLKLKDFFTEITAERKMTYDCYDNKKMQVKEHHGAPKNPSICAIYNVPDWSKKSFNEKRVFPPIYVGSFL